MITFTVPYGVAAVIAANLLILFISSVWFVRYVIKTMGILRAAELGTLFDQSAQRAAQEFSRETALVFDKVDEQRELLMKIFDRAQMLSDRLTPEALAEVIELRAQELANARINSEMNQRIYFEQQTVRLKNLVVGMTSTHADLVAAVKNGIAPDLDANLLGRVQAYCAQRGVQVGATNAPSKGWQR